MRFAASIHSVTEFGNDVVPFARGLDLVADCGFDSLMLLATPGGPTIDQAGDAGGCLIDVLRSDPARVRRALESRGLQLALTREACMDVRDAAAEARSAERLARLADWCAENGGDVGCNCGGAPAPMLPHAQKLDAIARLAEAVNRAMSGRRQRLAIDVHWQGTLETLVDCEAFLSRLDAVQGGILLNIGHMTTCGEDGWKAFERWPDQVPVVAWKDHLTGRGGPAVSSTELGKGDSPFARYLPAALANRERTHLVSFENLPLAEKPGALKRSADYLRRLWRERAAAAATR